MISEEEQEPDLDRMTPEEKAAHARGVVYEHNEKALHYADLAARGGEGATEAAFAGGRSYQKAVLAREAAITSLGSDWVAKQRIKAPGTPDFIPQPVLSPHFEFEL
jgi:hypothetical protein